MTKIPIFYTYETVDKPWGGANTFLKSLYLELSKSKNFELKPFRKNQSDIKILFLNQLSKGPLNTSSTFNRKEIELLRSNCKILIVRAVNLYSNGSYRISLRNPFLSIKQDNLSIYLTNIADHVIFQSEFQKKLFKKKGYIEKKSSVIHNGSSISKNIRDTDLERIFSKDPQKRCKQLQTGNPEVLKIYFIIKINDKYQNVEAVKIETIIHQFLKEHDGKHIINEWFELSDDMVVKIAECLIKSFE